MYISGERLQKEEYSEWDVKSRKGGHGWDFGGTIGSV